MSVKRRRVEVGLQGMVLVVLAGAWLAGMVLANSVPLAAGVWLVGAGGALLVCLGGWREQRLRLLAGMLVVLFLGAWRYTVETPREQPHSLAHLVGMRGLHVRGEISAEPTTTGHSRSLLIVAREVSISNGQNTKGTINGTGWQPAQGTLSVVTLGDTIIDPYGANYGDEVELTGTLQPVPTGPSAVVATMAFPRVHVSAHGGNALLEALFTLRVTLSQVLTRALPQPEAALLIAIFLSLHTPSLASLKADFNATGTAHLVAASGFKITLLAGLLAHLLSRLYEVLTAGRCYRRRGVRIGGAGWRPCWCWDASVVIRCSVARVRRRYARGLWGVSSTLRLAWGGAIMSIQLWLEQRW